MTSVKGLSLPIPCCHSDCAPESSAPTPFSSGATQDQGESSSLQPLWTTQSPLGQHSPLWGNTVPSGAALGRQQWGVIPDELRECEEVTGCQGWPGQDCEEEVAAGSYGPPAGGEGGLEEPSFPGGWGCSLVAVGGF